jgi:hypothetical protein
MRPSGPVYIIQGVVTTTLDCSRAQRRQINTMAEAGTSIFHDPNFVDPGGCRIASRRAWAMRRWTTVHLLTFSTLPRRTVCDGSGGFPGSRANYPEKPPTRERTGAQGNSTNLRAARAELA